MFEYFKIGAYSLLFSALIAITMAMTGEHDGTALVLFLMFSCCGFGAWAKLRIRKSMAARKRRHR